MKPGSSVHSAPTLARNAALGFAAQTAPLLVGLVALPVLIHGLGTQRFGAFQLAWVVLGYFAVFDLGLGRAANKFVAEHVARGDIDAMRATATGAVAVQLVTALIGGGMFAALVPTLVGHVLKVPAELTADVSRSFYLLVLALPAVLLGTSYSGMLQAVQRFDLVTAVQVPTGIATYGLPVLVLALGGDLTGVVAAVVAVRLIACGAYIALAYHAIPELLGPVRLRWTSLRQLAVFGGWVSVSNVATPIMLYLDRYVIGSLLGLSAVAYYTAPYDVIVRLTVVPASIVPPLFSAFSAFDGLGETKRLTDLFLRAARYLALAMIPSGIALIALARPGLSAWLGLAFSQHSTLPAQILAAGMVLNAMARLPFATLQAVGRADLPAKFHLVELPLYLGLLLLLTSRYGIAGAALAWSTRMTLDALLLYAAGLKRISTGVATFLWPLARTVAFPVLPFGAIVLAFSTGDSFWLRLAGTAIASVVGVALTWRFGLDERERAAIRRWLRNARTVAETR